MKSLKKIFGILSLSIVIISAAIVPDTSFAYSQNVQDKLDKISKNIAKQQEKISKQNEKRSRRSNSSGSDPKTEKIKDKISDLQEQASDIRAKEDKKISKVVDAIEKKKYQSNNKIVRLEKEKKEKMAIAKNKYDREVKKRKDQDPNYSPPVFYFNSRSVDGQISAEKDKVRNYNIDISKARSSPDPKKIKKSK
jgi:flagellar biosynthesis GTPase FlhF